MDQTLPASPRRSPAAPAPDDDFAERARALRPIYFVVVVWGEHFTDLLLQFCIPALLSPNNIPALHNRGNRFLIATTDEDWQRIEVHPVAALLRQHAELVFIRIPPPAEGVSFHLHMGVGHKLATQMAFEHRVYAVVLTPDLIVSDGSIALAQKHATEGVHLVLMPALRFGEEPLFEHLAKLGVASIDSRLGDHGRPLVATGRQLAWAGIRSFHSETLTYEWDASHFSAFPQACWWHVPGEDGIVLHSLSWFPLILDYKAVAEHDSSVMDSSTIDGDYLDRNFGPGARMYVVEDSDEAMLVSWAPLAERACSLAPNPEFERPLIGEWLKGLRFYEALCDPRFDPLKRNLFARPVFWHGGEINEPRWRAAEGMAARILRKYAGTLIGEAALRTESPVDAGRTLPTTALKIAWLIRAISQALMLFRHYWNHRWRVLGIARLAIRGDADARSRVKRSLRNLLWLDKR